MFVCYLLLFGPALLKFCLASKFTSGFWWDHFFWKCKNRKIVSIHFDNSVFALHLSKSFQKWAQKVHFPSTKKIRITNFFVTFSVNRVYCNNKPTNYQIWCMLVFITTFICIHLSQKQKQKNAFCRIFLPSLPHLFKMQCSSIVIEKFEYYYFVSIISIVDQWVFCGLLWFDLSRKVSWKLLPIWTRKIILLVKRLIS